MKMDKAFVFVVKRHHEAYRPHLELHDHGLRAWSKTAKWDEWNTELKETDTDIRIELHLNKAELVKALFESLPATDQVGLYHDLLDMICKKN